jgi:hypothetical protein
MIATDRPSVSELDELTRALDPRPLDRDALVTVLQQIEQGLREHCDSLKQRGGLLDEADRIHRPSLEREENRLRDRVCELLGECEELLHDLDDCEDEDVLRARGAELLAALRGLRDDEAHLVLDSADTEVGAGD